MSEKETADVTTIRGNVCERANKLLKPYFEFPVKKDCYFDRIKNAEDRMEYSTWAEINWLIPGFWRC